MRRTFARLYRVMIVLAGLALIAGTATASVPKAPKDLEATVVREYNTDGVKLTWKMTGDPKDRVYFRIYKTMRDTFMMPVVSINDTSVIDRDAPQNQHRYTFTLFQLEEGVHTFYVTAKNEDGESEESNRVTVDFRRSPTIGFENYPKGGSDSSLVVKLGDEFTFDANATASNGGDLVYSLTSAPDGMTIDPSTGLVSWTASQLGRFNVVVRATLADNQEVTAEQYWSIMVRSCPGDIRIEGKIKDFDGVAIKQGAVMVFQLENGYPRQITWANIESDGSYSLKVDEGGEYYMTAEGAEFLRRWYPAGNDYTDVPPITVACGDLAQIDFTVKRYAYQISGTVLSEETSEPILASVQFEAFNISDGSPATAYYTWASDVDGRFSAYLPVEYVWIASATPLTRDSMSNTPTIYLQQYYDGVATPAEATRLTFTAERNDINFRLKVRPPYANGISGSVTDANGTPVEGRLIAYNTSLNGESPRLGTTTQGTFTLENLMPGQYIVLVWPNEGFTGGYYVEGDLSTMEWAYATRLTVGESGLTQINIQMRPIEGERGRAKLRGVVSGKSGSIKSGRTSPQDADPIAGASLYAINAQGKVTAQSTTTATGEFNMNELKPGTYTISVDKYGYKGGSEVITITGEDEIGEITVALTQASSSVGQETAGAFGLTTYPNPTTTRLSVSFDGEAGSARVSLHDVTGTEVTSSRISTVAGANSASIDVEGLAAGVYVVRVDNGATIRTSTVTVVR